MPDLPARPDLDQLRRQAKELLRAARDGDPAAAGRMDAVSTGDPHLATAQLALAREYGFASWRGLATEVRRRAILDRRDLDGLRTLLRADRSQATDAMRHWCDHPLGAAPLNYVAMMRYDTAAGIWRDVPGTDELARALLAAGAPVDGEPGTPETPLMTAASYGDAGVARVLVEAGADVHATASDTAGGVPGGTALDHAAVFGMTDVVDVLTAAGARPRWVSIAAATGDVTGWLDDATPAGDRVRALMTAARHGRLDVIGRLVAAGTPDDDLEERYGGHPLGAAAGRPAAVRRLLAHGADPNLRDEHGRTALDVCRQAAAAHLDDRAHREVESILAPLTGPR